MQQPIEYRITKNIFSRFLQVVKDAIADRIPGAVYWNLFDMEMNFAKTMSTDNAIKLIEQYS